MSTGQGFLYICSFTYLIFGLLFTPYSPGIVTAEAQDNCQPIYGGGESCVQTGNVTINKTVQNPKTLQYVDNLDASSPKYNPGQIVLFQITVTNTSNNPIKNIEVKDLLPQNIDCASQETNQCNNATKIIAFTIDNLNARETKIYTLKGKIASISNQPEDKATICLVNQATAAQDKQAARDNSQFCIQKNETPSTTARQANTGSTKNGLTVFPPSKTKATPATGPETLALSALFASGLFGFILRKKSKIRLK